MIVKFKKLHEDAVLPSYANFGDAGADLVTVTDGQYARSVEGEDLWYYIEYKLGFAVEIPDFHVGLIFPRSSISKSSLSLANAIAVIDSSFRGEVSLRFKIDYGTVMDAYGLDLPPARYKKGDKIAQLIIVPIPAFCPIWSDELSVTARGTKGWGSSGT